MISSITIKNVATFDNESKPIKNLKKVNFFFGYNGTGKSTIARFLQNIDFPENKKSPNFKECSQTGYNSQNQQIVTFNDIFINDNFIQNDSLNGIFSLNKKNEVIDAQITSLYQLIKEYEERIKNIENKNIILKTKQKNEYELLLSKCWDFRGKFDTFVKIKLEYPGRKESHLNKIREELHRGIKDVYDIPELFNIYNSLYENEILEIPISIDTINYKTIRDIERELSVLLNEVIIGNEDVDIADLIKVLDNRNWVENGTEYLKISKNICPFCQKPTIDDDLKNQFTKYFDNLYKNKIERIKELYSRYNNSSKQFLLRLHEIGKLYNKDNMVLNEYSALKELFDANMIIISDKIQRPNEKMNIKSLMTHKKYLSGIIKTIKDANNVFNRLDDNKKQLKQMIWHYISHKCSSIISDFDRRNKKYGKIEIVSLRLINSIERKINDLRIEIEYLQSQTVNTEEAVKNINNILINSGFEGFEIKEISKSNNISKYQLKRPCNATMQDTFKTLSEGEKNFISFLYFYQLCIGTDNIQNSTKKKIIVIDDPISSLDSQALFIVSTLIRTLIQKKDNKKNKNNFNIELIDQFFLFTHNTYFYKEITFRRFICDDISYYLITKNKNITFVEYKSKLIISDDYELLWDTIKSVKNKLPDDNSLNILISNAMRRIIESYVNFIGIGKSSWDALIKVNKKEQNYFIWSAFISILNAESHKVSLYDTIYYQRLANVQPKILFDTFEKLFEEIGNEHYQYMMKENNENDQLDLFGD
jgi:wobble nucleotide-excising tRNase